MDIRKYVANILQEKTWQMLPPKISYEALVLAKTVLPYGSKVPFIVGTRMDYLLRDTHHPSRNILPPSLQPELSIYGFSPSSDSIFINHHYIGSRYRNKGFSYTYITDKEEKLSLMQIFPKSISDYNRFVGRSDGTHACRNPNIGIGILTEDSMPKGDPWSEFLTFYKKHEHNLTSAVRRNREHITSMNAICREMDDLARQGKTDNDAVDSIYEKFKKINQHYLECGNMNKGDENGM